jgi:hypothetical protein
MQDEYENINFWNENNKPKCCGSNGGVKAYVIFRDGTPKKDMDSVFLLGDAVTESGESIIVGDSIYHKL